MPGLDAGALIKRHYQEIMAHTFKSVVPIYGPDKDKRPLLTGSGMLLQIGNLWRLDDIKVVGVQTAGRRGFL